MADTDEVRIEIGFQGGTGVTVSADRAQWEQLQAAIESGGDNPWATLTAKDEATYKVAIDKVVYVRVVTLTRTIGFTN